MDKIGLIISGIAVLLIGVIAYLILANPEIDTGAAIDTNQAPVTSGENPQPGSSVHDLPIEPAAAVARQDLAGTLGADERNIVIVQIENKTWTDGCLGLGTAGEFCSQALVEGFRVEMLANGETYFYRTDKTGESMRPESR